MSWRARNAAAVLIFLGFMLRFSALFHNDLHPDEALFATWARLIGTGRDPLLVSQIVDKPPLLFYLQALFYPLLQTSSGWPARLPNLIAAMLLIPLTIKITWYLTRRETAALGAGLLIVVSPLAVQFSATAFIDPLLVTLLAAAFICVISDRPVGAGLLLGAALLTKYQAVLFLPLLGGAGWLRRWRPAAWRKAGLALTLAALVLPLWEWARTGRLLLWTNQINNFGGLRVAWSWELLPRLLNWIDLGQHLFGSAATVALAAGMVWLLIRHTHRVPAWAWLGGSFAAAYASLHWLLAIPVWDRYLLPLVPLLAVFGGVLLAAVFRWTNRPARGSRLVMLTVVLLLNVLLVPPALKAARGEFAVGGWPGADGGAAELAPLLADESWGTVLYDHWYSWQWRFHYVDGPVYVSWFPNTGALVDDLAVFGRDGTARYIALPNDIRAAPVRRGVDAAGFELLAVKSAGDMTLFRLQPR